MYFFIPYDKYNGFDNMAFDEAILSFVAQNKVKAVLRLYGWEKPTISIGRNQKQQDINCDFCQNNNIDIVKRPTGGRTLFHDKELTYAFICSQEILQNNQSVITSYKEISEALIIAFKNLGINCEIPEYKKVSTKAGYCMSLSTGSDLCVNGKKFVGSAQYRKNGYILQHGSIPFKLDFDIINKIFQEQQIPQKEEFNITTLNEIKPDCTIEILCNSIKNGFEEKFKAQFETKKLEELIQIGG